MKSIPLLDYYSDIRAIQYVNPVRDFDHAMSARWQGTPYTDKVLAYLKPEYNQLDQLLEQMNECPETEFIIYLPDRSNVPTRLGHHIQCFNQPLTLGSLLAEANFVICHAGAGLVAQACLAQVPILCLPLQYEQYLTARQVHRQGLGIMSPKVLPNNFVVEAVKHNPVEVRHRESKLSQDVLSYAQVFS
ncbi:hypothetical protein KOI40_00385 [Aestuariicella sp. G3-2]|uniref:glycosyltransferase n=1 Tax=Pseudomaricurvus albidus TaxID=2842452 RepID=UPI001C0CABB7|nr:hypothetical protein [Aestuariicella albida]